MGFLKIYGVQLRLWQKFLIRKDKEGKDIMQGREDWDFSEGRHGTGGKAGMESLKGREGNKKERVG